MQRFRQHFWARARARSWYLTHARVPSGFDGSRDSFGRENLSTTPAVFPSAREIHYIGTPDRNAFILIQLTLTYSAWLRAKGKKKVSTKHFQEPSEGKQKSCDVSGMKNKTCVCAASDGLVLGDAVGCRLLLSTTTLDILSPTQCVC